MNLGNIKTKLILFLSLFAIYLSVTEKSVVFIISLLFAVIFSVVTELIFIYFKEKKISITESSIITGLIIGYVLFTRPPWIMPLLACIIAISSKYLIRFNNKHIFNPAAFGIMAVILIFGAPTLWRGTYLWYILAPFGFYFNLKIRKLEILLGYFVTALFLFGVQAHYQGVNIFNIFGYLSYFYIFIMLIEPKTTPVKPVGKILFGMAAAVFIFYFTEKGVSFDAELAALLTCNMLTPLLNKLK